jgi:hypothetical protein
MPKIKMKKALDKVDRNNGQARFRGNETVPIQQEINEKRLLKNLSTFQKSHGVGGQVQELVSTLSTTSWKITAGVHQGGLGGAAGTADLRKHITLSTGHHLRLGSGQKIVEITGPGISQTKVRQQRTDAIANVARDSATGSVGWVTANYGLNHKEAVKAILEKSKDNNGTWEKISQKIKSQSKNGPLRTKK